MHEITLNLRNVGESKTSRISYLTPSFPQNVQELILDRYRAEEEQCKIDNSLVSLSSFLKTTGIDSKFDRDDLVTGFERGVYLIFVDGFLIKCLSHPIKLTEDLDITIIKMTFYN